MSLFRILYTSRSTPLPGAPEMTKADIEGLASKSSKSNQYRGVTGVLLHVDGTFIQVLEGPIGTLEGLFETIVCDVRHSDINLLVHSPVPDSLFPVWSMFFVAADEQHNDPRLQVALAEIKHASEANGPAALGKIEQLVAGQR